VNSKQLIQVHEELVADDVVVAAPPRKVQAS